MKTCKEIIVNLKTLLLWNLIFFTFIYGNSGFAQINRSHYSNLTHYTSENGLASTEVLDIQEDKHGFLWIATGKGVARFDGNHFSNFEFYNKNTSPGKIGHVNTLLIDKNGETIWIGSDKGIFYSDVDDVNFKKIEALINSIDFPVGRTRGLFLDDQKKLWSVGLDEGLMRFDVTKNKYEKFSFVIDFQKDNSKINELTGISNDALDPTILWIGSVAGLIRFNMVSKKYQVFIYHNNLDSPQNQVRKIGVSDKEVFMGTYTEGLVVFDKNSEQFHQPLKENYPNSHTLILDIYKENNTYLWITTNHGLIQYNLQSNAIEKIIDHNMARGMFRGISFLDSRGIIWFCDGKGLFKYDPFIVQNKFITLEERSKLENPLLVREIIFLDGFIYVLGHSSKGLYKINPLDYSFEVIKLPIVKHKNKTDYSLRDMVVTEDGNLLILSAREIMVFNPNSNKSVLAPLQINHPNPSFQAVVKDKDNNYWIASRQGGLYCVNFKDNKITNYKKQFDRFTDGNYRWINSLFIDSKNKLWIGKGSNNIIMDLDDFSVICVDPNGKNNIRSYQDVDGFYEDNNGRVWVTGRSEGLGYATFNTFNNGVSQIVDGYFRGVYHYKDSVLWTVGKELGELNTNTMEHKTIKLNSNIDNLSVSGPILGNGNGEFIIGCNNGIVIYNPKKPEIILKNPVPYIRKITSNGKTLYDGNNLEINDFKFKNSTKNITVNISALGFHQPDMTHYKYSIQGQWLDLAENNEINFTNLSYGDYDLRIKTSNNLGLSDQIPSEYRITILRPWWATWWAYFIYAAIAITFADRFYHFQLSKKLAISESKRLKEVSQLKNSLYTNITHEFRTPLTVILGMAGVLKSDLKNKSSTETTQSVEMIERNGNNLLGLVNEMLDLAKLENGNMELEPIQADVVPFVKYLCESFSLLAKQSDINLVLSTELDELFMDFDTAKLSAVVSNLLSNAVKFTPDGGKIIVRLHKFQNNGKESFIIKVKDNGIGISEEDKVNIFNRFYQVGNSKSKKNGGTGIGLALTKELVELMNGTIEVNSKSGNGSEFTVMVPITRAAIESNRIQLPISHITSSVPTLITSEELSVPNVDLPVALIIEDNADVAHYLKTCLFGKYKTLYAANGSIGIDMAYDHIPDIIISDVMMPSRSGFEVCETLKTDERTDHIPIIMLTAKVTMKDRLSGLSHGADAYLTKPFNKEELFTRLDQLVLMRKKLIGKLEKNGFSILLNEKPENPQTKFLQQILKIIQTNLDNSSFNSAHLAKEMFLSESQIYRKLKAITDKSTAIFIRSVRLQRAKELIQTSHKTVSEIAYEVGFNDPSWFSRAFKEEFDLAPSEFRK